MDNGTIQAFLERRDLDIRKTHNGRSIDQKCTMDVMCLAAKAGGNQRQSAGNESYFRLEGTRPVSRLNAREK